VELMSDLIDATVPVGPNAYTLDQRNNWQATINRLAAIGAVLDTGPFLPTRGGQMLGSLFLNADPLRDTEAATKRYVDIAVNAGTSTDYLRLDGGTMLGPLTLAGDPVMPLDAATMDFVERSIADALTAELADYLPLTGGALSGPLRVPNGTMGVPGLGLGIADGTGLSRSGNAMLLGVQSSFVLALFAGASQFYCSLSMLNNSITQLADATNPGDALNLRTADARYLQLYGGTLSGPLVAPGLYATADQGLALYDDGNGTRYLQFYPGWSWVYDTDDGLCWIANGSYVLSIDDSGTLNANGLYLQGTFEAYGGMLHALLDMVYNPIVNVADAQNPTDALNMQSGDARYAPIALAAELAALRAELLILRGSA
jgi:hypothetical protein